MASGFKFGGNNTGSPALGGTGTPGGFSFGGTNTAAVQPQATKPSGFSFGTTPASTAAAPLAKPAFGGLGGTTTTSTAAPGGFSFGLTSATTASTGLAPTATTAATGFSLPATSTLGGLGAAKPAGSTGLGLGGTTGGFGLTTTTTASTPLTGLGGGLGALGSTTTAATGFTLPTKTTTAATGLAASTAPSLSFPSLGATTTQPSALGSLGGITSQPSALGSLGVTTAQAGALGSLGTTASQPSVLGSLLKPTGTATTAAGFSLAATTAAAPTTTTFKGLGGVDQTSSTAAGATSKDGKTGDGKSVKDQALPQPLMDTVTKFKEFEREVKEQQSCVSRQSVKPLEKISSELTGLRQSLATLTAALQRSASTLEQLKATAAQDLKDAEMAQRTKDTPAGLQYENNAPMQYFQRVVRECSSQLVSYRRQVAELEQYMYTASATQPISPHDLVQLLRRLHESFISLAAQLYSVNSRVQTLRDDHLALRRSLIGDTTDIFAARKQLRSTSFKQAASTVLEGPSAFQDVGSSSSTAAAVLAALNRQQQPTVAVQPTSGLGTGLNTTGLGAGLNATGLGLNKTGLGTGLNTTGLGNTTGFGFGSTAKPTANTSFGNTSAFGSTFGQTPTIGSNTSAFGTTSGFGATQSGAFTLQNPPRKKRSN